MRSTAEKTWSVAPTARANSVVSRTLTIRSFALAITRLGRSRPAPNVPVWYQRFCRCRSLRKVAFPPKGRGFRHVGSTDLRFNPIRNVASIQTVLDRSRREHLHRKEQAIEEAEASTYRFTVGACDEHQMGDNPGTQVPRSQSGNSRTKAVPYQYNRYAVRTVNHRYILRKKRNPGPTPLHLQVGRQNDRKALLRERPERRPERAAYTIPVYEHRYRLRHAGRSRVPAPAPSNGAEAMSPVQSFT